MILKNGSGFDRATVRTCVLEHQLLPYKCAICELGPSWNGHALTMTLGHINGDSKAHDITNLRWVCPNCNAQLPTTAGKRNKGMHYKKRATYTRHKRLSIPYHD